MGNTDIVAGETVVHRGLDGRLLYLGVRSFVSQIVDRNGCFLCGVESDEREFTDEHIVPRWLQRRYDLADETVGLTNEETKRYGRYALRCCSDCNSFLGREIEEPISRLLDGDYRAVLGRIDDDARSLLMEWLSLVFIKTHLRDRGYRFWPDLRKPDAKISDGIYWPDLHHIYCVARARYARCTLGPAATSSLLLLEAKVAAHISSFDFVDVSSARACMLRLGDLALIAVLDDAGGALSLAEKYLALIQGPLSPLQLREVLAYLACANIDLEPRPRFFSRFDANGGRIGVELPDLWDAAPRNKARYGSLLDRLVGPILSQLDLDPDELAETRRLIGTGDFSFLVDSAGRFTANCMDVVELT